MEHTPDAVDDDDERTIELSSIAAIFPEIVFDSQSPFRASLDIPVSPASPLKIQFHHPNAASYPRLSTPPTSTETDADDQHAVIPHGSEGKEQEAPDIHSLVHLPSLRMKMLLPQGYPTEKPPTFELSSSPAWIPTATLERLTKDALRLWEDLGRDQVVFAYIDHLQQAIEAGFDLAKDLGDDLTLSADLKIALLDYDLQAKREAFEKQTFHCGICLDPKRGALCHQFLLCSHVFCVDCLQECYNKCISEGDVDNVKCLVPGCGRTAPAIAQADQGGMARKPRRHDPTLSPSELLQIPLAEEVVQRYVHLKRKKKLESDKNTVYCPRQWCQGAARSKKHPKPIDPMHDVEDVTSESESLVGEAHNKPSKKSKMKGIPMAERLCICEDCSYAFCSVCRKGWHGEMISYSLCNPRSEKELTDEEKASAEYLSLHSTACPTCSAPCQKTMGCNHMICFKCRTHFCYLCSSYLMESNPYQHFNDEYSTCYMRLWELEGGDGEHAPVVAWERPADDDGDSDIDSDDTDDDQRDINWLERNPPRENAARFQDEDENGQEPLQRDLDHPPAPAEIRIEIVNFAREGVGNQHIPQVIQVPHQPPPPPAPAPPRRGGGRGAARGGGRAPGPLHPNRNQGRGGGRGRAPPPHPRAVVPNRALPNPPRAALINPNPLHAPHADAAVAAADDSNSSDTEDEVPLRFPRAAPAPGQGNNGHQQPAMLRQMGLERFLALAEQDLEDEWDSDELEF
jgi:E3 ubiquitin-protein ligase RNF14